MKKLLLTLLPLLFVTSVFADTTFVSGTQSGTWSPALGDPYIVTGVITIPEDGSLTIEAGTRIEFINGHGLIAYGPVYTNGTAANPVVFTQDTNRYPVRWRGIRLFSETDTSRFNHTNFYNGEGYSGIVRVGESRAVISNCVFSGMTLIAIEINGGWAEVTDTQMRDRFGTNGGWGAGITVMPGSVNAVRCTFSNLHTLDGGAIEVSQGGQGTFTDCIFENNWALIWGGVAYIYSSSVTFDNCLFKGNHGNVGSIARVMGNSTTMFTHCVFEDNRNETNTFGLLELEEGGPHIIDHCLFVDNITTSVWPQHNLIFASAPTTITHTAFFGNTRPPLLSGTGIEIISYCAFGSPEDIYNEFHDDLPAGFGILSTVNQNGDSTDSYGNLFASPEFDPSGPYGEYSLYQFSDLVNAGDPTGTPDPDGTIPDIGPYPFFHLQTISDLTIERIGNLNHIRLRWSQVPDAVEYWIFRANDGVFNLNEADFLGATPSEEFVDLDVLGTSYSKRTYAVMASQVSSDVALPFLHR